MEASKRVETVVKKKKIAELSREFLVLMLEKWRTLGPIKIAEFVMPSSERLPQELRLQVVKIPKDKKDILKINGGIYFICCENTDKGTYPVYVGMTGQTFNERLKQHRREKGVLAEIYSEGWEKNFCQIFTLYVMAADIPTAKFLESTFLDAFDFARNKEENSKTKARPLVTDGFDVDGKTHFLETLNDKFINLENTINILKSTLL